MPREANRIILQITEIGIELLNEISDQDLLNEGIHEFHHQERKPGTWWSADPGDPTHFDGTPRGTFKKLWNSVGGNWTDNPLVWVISFKCHAQSA